MKLSRKGLVPAVVFALVSSVLPLEARADAGFVRWINEFSATASKNGISTKTYKAAFAGVTEPDPAVLEKARYQPEFKSAIWDYLDSRVNPYTVSVGQEMAAKHGRTLAALERHFGIDRTVLLAIWSMETNYGAALEKTDRLHNIPRALATLAYADSRRAKFARTQLIAALKILQSGDVSASGLVGSWAGAMGHTQFIPTSYLLYAIDADGNGHRDIWNSVPDALATAANLLAKNGWQTGKTWGYETIVPKGGAKHEGKTMTLAQWEKLGFKRPSGKGFRFPNDRAELKMLGGPNGPGFLMTRNFFVLKKYNAADSYALGVGLLADEIAGYGGMAQSWPRPHGSLDIKEKFELQSRMKELGYYNGNIDGNFGSGSKAAITAIQSRLGMTIDGEPSRHLLDALRN
ncbi:lytic murein transglycosylase [Ciceribacter sp. L1K23]|uniref:lytic murein transglycosylase n=1 Tax=unclassified Ciceribacter TaxID=2628820 RepID=UPI001ABE76A9|nr:MULTISPECIES: lytic murein transglycosylase [unclassified Ciceribacter]MBO3761845.1 lytic murein transglycosylase [Ciceribacter sp. L1K22]MBR0558247.1 lytic murein transglycosylase [Ciceribacter sp. L1K23]